MSVCLSNQNSKIPRVVTLRLYIKIHIPSQLVQLHGAKQGWRGEHVRSARVMFCDFDGSEVQRHALCGGCPWGGSSLAIEANVRVTIRRVRGFLLGLGGWVWLDVAWFRFETVCWFGQFLISLR
jgi:hypothetical protein